MQLARRLGSKVDGRPEAAPIQSAQQCTGTWAAPIWRCQRTMPPQRATGPRIQARCVPCACSTMFKVAAVLIVAFAPWLSGAATLIFATRTNASALPTVANDNGLAELSYLTAVDAYIAPKGTFRDVCKIARDGERGRQASPPRAYCSVACNGSC
jgi:hypothetical protein